MPVGMVVSVLIGVKREGVGVKVGAGAEGCRMWRNGKATSI